MPMEKRYRIVEDTVERGRTCSICNDPDPNRIFHKHVVKVIDTRTGIEEWRCNKHVRSLSREVAHKLTDLDLVSNRTG